MAYKITVKDNGYNKLVEQVYGFKKQTVEVGIFAADAAKVHDDSDGQGHKMTLGEIAAVHEFGLGNVPERSYLRAYIDQHEAELRNKFALLLQSVIKGKRTKEEVLDIIGQYIVGEIQKRISSNIPPPLVPSTIKQKGSSVALIDTGQLRASISYRVNGGQVKRGQETSISTHAHDQRVRGKDKAGPSQAQPKQGPRQRDERGRFLKR